MSKLRHLESLTRRPVTRRSFLIGATATGLTMAFAPLVQATGSASQNLEAFEPTVWFSVDVEGLVHVNVAEAEMGQHVGSALARIVAEELEAQWRHVRLNYVDSEARYGYRVTGGSWSIWQNFELLSRAAAAGRQALIEAGAAMLNEAPFKCSAESGYVVCGAKQVSYGEIVRSGSIDRVFSEEELAEMPIKPASERRLVGQDFQALDIPDKAKGAAVYGIDAEWPGMVYAKPIIPPTRYGSTVLSVNDDKAKQVAGYQQSIVLEDPSNTVPGWVPVIANSYHAAIRASKLVDVEYELGPTAHVSEGDIQARSRVLLDEDVGSLVIDDPDVDQNFNQAASTLEAEYTTASVLHFQLEPVNALAMQRDGIWELHTGNQ